MKCLSRQQLAQLALGLADDAENMAHVAECVACRTTLATMRSLVRQLSAAHVGLNEGHEAARERLLAILPTTSRLPEPVKPWNRMAHWMGGPTMRQRIAVGGVGVAAALGLLLVWAAVVAKPVSAMAKMAEAARKATSFKSSTAEQFAEFVVAPDSGKPEKVTVTGTEMGYWLSSGAYRHEVNSGHVRQTGISHADGSGILLNHRTKTFERYAAGRERSKSIMDDVQFLGNFSGKADRQLGTKELNGKKALGFEIGGEKLYPDAPQTAPRTEEVWEIWLDSESNLPVRLRREQKWTANEGDSKRVYIADIQWNIDLDPKLFDLTPPEGYTDKTPKPPSPDAARQIAEEIIEGLRIYAAASGGRYPTGRLYTRRVEIELQELMGIDGRRTAEQGHDNPTSDADRQKFARVSRASQGIGHISGTLDFNPDGAYYGKTVGPSDKDKVLLRWKLDDGQYEVIFGDLRAETVTVERLRALEGK